MEKNFAYRLLGFALIFVAIDLALNAWAFARLESSVSVGPLLLQAIPDYGGGRFADLTGGVLAMLTAAAAALFAATAFAVIALFPSELRALPIGLTLSASGAVANAVDRFSRGFAVDLFQLRFGTWQTTSFNLADLALLIGFTTTLAAMIGGAQKFWSAGNKRKRILVNPEFQRRFFLWMLSAMTAGFAIVAMIAWAILSYGADRTLVAPVDPANLRTAAFFLAITITYCAMAVVLYVASLFLSHRIAGPLWKFLVVTKGNLQGRDLPLILRDRDEFKADLERLAEELRVRLKER